MKAQWRCKYDYQAASWIVYRGNRRLRDYFGTRELAQAAAQAMNRGAIAEKDTRNQVRPTGQRAKAAEVDEI